MYVCKYKPIFIYLYACIVFQIFTADFCIFAVYFVN